MKRLLTTALSLLAACGSSPAVEEVCKTGVGSGAQLSIVGGTTADDAPVITSNNDDTLIIVEHPDAGSVAYVRYHNQLSLDSQAMLVGVLRLGSGVSLPTLPVEFATADGGSSRLQPGTSPCTQADSFWVVSMPPGTDTVMKFGPTAESSFQVRLSIAPIPLSEATP